MRALQVTLTSEAVDPAIDLHTLSSKRNQVTDLCFLSWRQGGILLDGDPPGFFQILGPLLCILCLLLGTVLGLLALNSPKLFGLLHGRLRSWLILLQQKRCP